jgi:hypothetical protein
VFVWHCSHVWVWVWAWVWVMVWMCGGVDV